MEYLFDVIEIRIQSIFVEIDRICDDLLKEIDLIEKGIIKKKRRNRIKIKNELTPMKKIGIFYNELDSENNWFNYKS
jgi:hypothetical protein